MDLVYILGTGSRYQNLEIMLSIRTVEKYVKHDRIVIVGEKPKQLNYSKKLVHIPHETQTTGFKNTRIAKRVEFICNHPDISENFFFFNDDFFVTEKINPKTYPYYHKGKLTTSPKNPYDVILKNTHNYLKAMGETTLHYDVHTPIIYNKTKFRDIAHHFKNNKEKVVKSIYCNIHKVKGVFCHDVKLRKPDEERKSINKLFSTYDDLTKNGLLKWIVEMNPEKSSHEKEFECIVRAKIKFKDKYTKKIYYTGQSFIVSFERYIEIARYVNLVDFVF